MRARISVGWVLIGSALVGCSPDTSPVVVGVAEGLQQGPLADAVREAAVRAAAEINAGGGIHGRRLELRFVDHGLNDVERSLAAATELVENDSILAVIGHANSLSTMVAEPIYRGRVALLTPIAAAGGVASPAWSFRLDAVPSQYGNGIVDLVESYGVQRIAVYFDNTPVARGQAGAVRAGLAAPLVLEEPLYTEAAAGPHGPLVEALVMHDVDVVVLVTGIANTGVLVPAISRRLPSARIVGITWTGFEQRGSLRSHHVLAPAFLAERGDMVGANGGDAPGPGEGPNLRETLMYDAVHLLARAIREAGRDRTAIAGWLRALGGTSSFTGVSGPVEFDERGDRVGFSLAALAACSDGTLGRPDCP